MGAGGGGRECLFRGNGFGFVVVPGLVGNSEGFAEGGGGVEAGFRIFVLEALDHAFESGVEVSKALVGHARGAGAGFTDEGGLEASADLAGGAKEVLGHFFGFAFVDFFVLEDFPRDYGAAACSCQRGHIAG